MTTTLDPANTSANIALSEGNLRGANTAVGVTSAISRSVASVASGTYYVEYTIMNIGTQNGAGIIDATQSLNSYMGVNIHGIGYYKDNSVQFNGGVVDHLATFTTGDVIGMAVDLNNDTIWWRKNGGVWNHGAGADPTTNTGGISFAGMGATAFASLYVEENPDDIRVNFGASAYANAAPSGFLDWAAVAATPILFPAQPVAATYRKISFVAY